MGKGGWCFCIIIIGIGESRYDPLQWLDSHQREVFIPKILMDKWPSDIIDLDTIMEIGLCSEMAHPLNITWCRVVSLSKQQFTQDYI